MKMKIKKYIKFFISMMMIFSFVFSSYAALSSSDGSIFVTKAEFDSALSDFNSRLTTFEAGINSKIDSQVSAYLNRNGIWSAKVINFEDTDSGDGGYYWCKEWPDVWSYPGYTAEYNVNVTIRGNQYGYNTTGEWYIGKANKTGLLFLSVQWYGAGDYRDCYRLATNNNLQSNNMIDSLHFGIGSLYDATGIRFWNTADTTTVLTHKDISEIKASSLVGGGAGLYEARGYYSTPKNEAAFFVTNGDNIYVTRVLFAGCPGNATLYAAMSWGGANDDSDAKLRRPHFELTQAEIY